LRFFKSLLRVLPLSIEGMPAKLHWESTMADPATDLRGRADTRTRILDAAQDGVLTKGFDATSIDEIVAEVGISRAGFFYHFPDKNALALALLERHILVEDAIFDGLEARAADLSDDVLQRFLIMLRLLAELLDDMPNGHPGCLVATAAYQDRLFNAEVRAANQRAVRGWRARFRAHLETIAAQYPPAEPVDLDDLADMVNVVVEGGIVMSKALGDPQATARQVLLFRALVKRLFQPGAVRPG
jgi:AcrR family transcriptional regulator